MKIFKWLAPLAALSLYACAGLGSGPGRCSTAASYPLLYACLQTLSVEQLGFDNPKQRKQYLLFAEKLAQDMALKVLSDADARTGLKARYQRLQIDPQRAVQCARFAERILCY